MAERKPVQVRDGVWFQMEVRARWSLRRRRLGMVADMHRPSVSLKAAAISFEGGGGRRTEDRGAFSWARATYVLGLGIHTPGGSAPRRRRVSNARYFGQDFDEEKHRVAAIYGIYRGFLIFGSLSLLDCRRAGRS